MVGDEAEQRIWDAVRNHFTRIAEREFGWAVLYLDPSDATYWELSFPQSELQGGGPAKLTRMAADQILILYPALPLP